MKIGVCGIAGLGWDFAELFLVHPDVESVHVADLSADCRARAAEKQGLAGVHETFEQLLDADVDCIGVFTPPWLHADQAVRALDAGKHVYCACPAGLTLEELRSVIDTVERTGRIYMTAETGYYYPPAMYARQAWSEGRFGQFVYGEGEYYYRPHAYPFWLRDGYGNMPPMLYPTHSASMVISVTGRRIERITCVGTPGLHPDAADKKRRDEWRDNEVSNMTALGVMSGGGVCRINEMRNVGCKGELGSLFGTLGSLRQVAGAAVWTDGLDEDIDLVDLWKDPAKHPQTALTQRLPEPLRERGLGHWGSHRFLADEFVRAVTQNKRPHNHVWMAAKYCAFGIVAWESLKRGGQWLDVPDFGDPTDAREPLAY